MPDIQNFAFLLEKNPESGFRLACLNMFTNSPGEYQGLVSIPSMLQGMIRDQYLSLSQTRYFWVD